MHYYSFIDTPFSIKIKVFHKFVQHKHDMSWCVCGSLLIHRSVSLLNVGRVVELSNRNSAFICTKVVSFDHDCR